MSTITLKTDAGQRFCGLHLDRVDGFGLSVLVLPKAWSVSRNANRLVHVDEHSAVVVMHEGDDVCLDVRSNDVADALVEMSREGRRIARDDANADAARGELEADTLSVQAEAKRRMLVRLEAAGKEPTQQAGTPEIVHKALADGMLALLEMSHRLRDVTRVDHDLDASEHWGALVDTQGGEMDPPLLLLAQWRFVQGMERQLRRIRRGYVPTVGREPVIRGRITQRGLVQAGMGELAIECAYDEFVETTPLYRILVTALDHVAMGAMASRHGLTEWSLHKEVQATAIRLRRQLAPIPSLPFAVAAQRAGQLRLPALHRDWQPLLDLARALLRNEAPRGGAPRGTACSFQWRISTAHVWERWLALAAEGAGLVVEGAASDEGTAITPWHGLGKPKRPDLILREASGDLCVIVDAKYKRPPKTPSPADQYQIWFYSLAITGVTGAALVYPRMGDSDGELGPRGSYVRVEPGGLPGTVYLHVLVLPFPPNPGAKEADAQETDVKTWDGELEKVCAALVELAGSAS